MPTGAAESVAAMKRMLEKYLLSKCADTSTTHGPAAGLKEATTLHMGLLPNGVAAVKQSSSSSHLSPAIVLLMYCRV
eukprot:CAMPEP_0181316878 /NCGR_PEP_ID=MMETSP1101-20121128/16130_1 /TAXON_ID=46948 /ORGANISM="Rhodomonas abbreviata, Strain Caron Lab Isolate" /LENGTH=76 /DNA_ID=CAMNT_0023424155 /DNA_START=237 /DNA_END=467 /DNA_ORIENTATION=+